MRIKQDPVTKLWCREDGAVLLPPSGIMFTKFRWVFGSSDKRGYRHVGHRGKVHQVHRLVCRAFHGLPPEDKPFVDHISRIPWDNRPANLRYVDCKGNADNQAAVDRSVEKYGVRNCDDHKAYMKAHDAVYRAEKKALGLVMRRGPDGKKGWFPRVRPMKEVPGAYS